MHPTKCASPQMYRQLLLGKLSAEKAEALEYHLLHCDDCALLFDTIFAVSDVIDALKLEDQLDCEDEHLVQAMDQCKELYSEVETIQAHDTDSQSSKGQQDTLTNQNGEFNEEIDFLAPAQRANEIGRLGGYRVLKVLGTGGMGIVFKAEDPVLKRLVALKVMKPEMAVVKSVKARFLREAQSIASLQHENIVQVYQVSEDCGVPFMAMPLLQGESLQDRLDRDGQLDQREVIRIGREIASGLSAAHEQDLIHRDIKPDNIWIESESGQIKILDFGLVRPVSTEDSNLTESGMVMGTPKYMSPEQAEGEDVDQRCDLFSLGSVLYHATTGKIPFWGRTKNATLLAVSHSEPESIEELCPNVHPALTKLIMQLLRKSEDERPQSAIEVIERLAEIQLLLEQKDSSDTQILSSSSETEVPQAQPKTNRTVFIGGGVAIALGFLFVLWAAGFLFRLETADGTLIVKVNDDKFSTMVQGQKVTIENTESGEKHTIQLGGAGQKKDLKPGEYQFLFESNSGLKMLTDHFTIISGKNHAVEVWWVDPDPSPKELIPVKPGIGWNGWPSKAPEPLIAPFNKEQVKQAQGAWAKYLRIPVENVFSIREGVTMKLMLIPPGDYVVGSSEEDLLRLLNDAKGAEAKKQFSSEASEHRVRIAKPLWISRKEVTRVQFQEFIKATKYKTDAEKEQPVTGVWNESASPQTNQHPVVNVSWNDATAFCQWLTDERGHHKYLLPTEAQWEIACRAGSTTLWNGGINDQAGLKNQAWFKANSSDTIHQVGQLKGNAFGLYDMHGNAQEWCADWYAKGQGGAAVQDNPTGPAKGSRKVVRGGSWNSDALHGRSASRTDERPDFSSPDLGFRIIMTVPGADRILD